MTDPVVNVLSQALNGLADRQRVIANNVANVETPGYLAEKVDFESSLQQAIAAGNPEQASISTTTTTDPTNQNGNNVNLDDQVVGLMQTNLSYQTMIDGINAKFRLVREAIGNGN